MLALLPETLQDVKMDTELVKELGICPLRVIEHLLRDMTLGHYVTFVVWLDET